MFYMIYGSWICQPFTNRKEYTVKSSKGVDDLNMYRLLIVWVFFFFLSFVHHSWYMRWQNSTKCKRSNGSCVVSRFISSPPGQNGRHFAENIFICIFVNEMFCILIKISQMFVLNSLIDNNKVLVKQMVCLLFGGEQSFRIHHFCARESILMSIWF